MAMALRTMAAKLKQKIPGAVQRVFASSRAPATADANLDRFGPEFRRLLDQLVEKNRKSRRDDALAAGAGIGLGAVTLVYVIRYLGGAYRDE